MQWRRPWPFNVGGWRWPDWPPRVNGPRKSPRAPAPPAAASPGCLSELHDGLPWPNGLATPVANSTRVAIQPRTLRQFNVIQCAERPVKSDPRRVRTDNISSPLLPWLIGSYGHAPPALWPSACVVQRVSGASQSRARRGWARFPPFLPKDPRARPPHSPWRGARPARGIPPGHSTPGRAARRPSRARVSRPVIQRFYRRALGHPKAPCPPFPKAPKNPGLPAPARWRQFNVL